MLATVTKVETYQPARPLALKPPNRDGVKVQNGWATDARWILPLTASKTLTKANQPKTTDRYGLRRMSRLATLNLTYDMAVGLIPGHGTTTEPMGDPDRIVSDNGHELDPAVVFFVGIDEFGLSRKLYDWITRRLGLRIGAPSTPKSAIPILDTDNVVIGAVMPISLERFEL